MKNSASRICHQGMAERDYIIVISPHSIPLPREERGFLRRTESEMDDTFFMKEALKEAQKAFEADEVPIGAVAVYKNQIIGRGHNRTEHLQDPTAHAEIIAITAAANALGSWRLEDVDVYTTIEPCIMCAGALVLARVRKVIFGARDEKFGGCGSIFNIVNEQKLNHQIEINEGLLKEQASSLMKRFFKKKREKTAAKDAAVESQSED
jgi:tRNA(adenine34) deaminase